MTRPARPEASVKFWRMRKEVRPLPTRSPGFRGALEASGLERVAMMGRPILFQVLRRCKAWARMSLYCCCAPSVFVPFPTRVSLAEGHCYGAYRNCRPSDLQPQPVGHADDVQVAGAAAPVVLSHVIEIGSEIAVEPTAHAGREAIAHKVVHAPIVEDFVRGE